MRPSAGLASASPLTSRLSFWSASHCQKTRGAPPATVYILAPFIVHSIVKDPRCAASTRSSPPSLPTNHRVLHWLAAPTDLHAPVCHPPAAHPSPLNAQKLGSTPPCRMPRTVHNPMNFDFMLCLVPFVGGAQCHLLSVLCLYSYITARWGRSRPSTTSTHWA